MSVKKKKLVIVGVALSLVAGCTATAVVLTRDEGEAVAEDNPLLEATETSRATTTLALTTTAPETTTTAVPLPVPEAPPADPHARVPIVQIGAIHIPKMGVQHAIFEGITLTVINRGPGHWPGTAMPGQVGNTVFPGHRTTYSRPFHDLDKLGPGDQIVFQMPEADYVYEYRETLIVKPTDMWVVDQGTTPTVTLIACHPKGSAAQRIVVKGDLIASIPK